MGTGGWRNCVCKRTTQLILSFTPVRVHVGREAVTCITVSQPAPCERIHRTPHEVGVPVPGSDVQTEAWRGSATVQRHGAYSALCQRGHQAPRDSPTAGGGHGATSLAGAASPASCICSQLRPRSPAPRKSLHLVMATISWLFCVELFIILFHHPSDTEKVDFM